MLQRNMFVRFGNGSLRQVRDQAEAERIKRETGDEDMFVFQEPKKDRDRKTIWPKQEPRDAQQDTRDMEAKAKKMLEPSVAGKIARGLGELWTKAPAGIVEGVSEGTKAIGKAGGRLVDTFLHDEGMHKGLKKAGLFALAGAALPTAIVLPYAAAEAAPALAAWGGQAVRAAGTTLLTNPQLINEATDLVESALTPGPGSPTRGGFAGTLLGYPWGSIQSPKNKGNK